MSGKMAIIGRNDMFMGFKALGITVADPSGQDDDTAGTLFEKLIPEKYSIIFVAEEYAKDIMENISQRNSLTAQAVTVIPSGRKSDGTAALRIRQLVRRAIGADIM